MKTKIILALFCVALYTSCQKDSITGNTNGNQNENQKENDDENEGGGNGTGGGSTTGGGGGGGTTTGTTISFANDVQPLINSYCVNCHSSYSSYNGVYSGRSGIKSTIANGSMPKGTSMSTDQKNTVIGWVDGGAPNN